MADLLARLRRFLRELKRRNVYKVAATLVAGFVVLQLAGLAAAAFGLPGWFEPMVWVLCGLGFPLALVVAWAFEMSPEGVRRTPEADPAAEDADSAGSRRSESRLAVQALVELGVVAAVLAGVWHLMGGGGESPELSEGTVAVLPFQVSGPESETWREGMVTMLSTGLDGAASRRARSSRAFVRSPGTRSCFGRSSRSTSASGTRFAGWTSTSTRRGRSRTR